MKTTFRLFVACAVAVSFAGAASAQVPSQSSVQLELAPAEFPAGQLVSSSAPSATAVPSTAPAVLTPQPAECLGQTTGSDGPWVVIAPFVWIPGMHGQVGAGGRVQTVNFSVSDAAHAAVDDLKGALMLHVEAGFEQVGFISDLTYLRLVPLNGIARAESTSVMFEFLGFYRVYGNGCREPGAVTLDVLAGLRFYRFTNTLQLNGVDLSPRERTDTWTDLVVGARVGVQVTDRLDLFARGDIGGFGISDSSTQACNVITGFEYQCSQCCSLFGGYRWLMIDRSSGVGRDAFLIDATLSGPFIALGLRF